MINKQAHRDLNSFNKTSLELVGASVNFLNDKVVWVTLSSREVTDRLMGVHINIKHYSCKMHLEKREKIRKRNITFKHNSLVTNGQMDIDTTRNDNGFDALGKCE